MNSREFSAALRAAGQRPTPQRLLILQAMGTTDGHLTADEIYHQVQQTYPTINLSTVYRTLDALKDLGIVTETNLGEGRREFELAEHGRHHHLVCRECGSVEALDDDAFVPIRNYALQHHGFQAEVAHYALFGICRMCAAAGLNRTAEG